MPFQVILMLQKHLKFHSTSFSLCHLLFVGIGPTSEFPHPLSRVRQPVANRLSYQIVDALIWMGMRDIINEFRKKLLKLRPVTYLSASYTSPHDLSYRYIWSPHLVPKPKGMKAERYNKQINGNRFLFLRPCINLFTSSSASSKCGQVSLKILYIYWIMFHTIGYSYNVLLLFIMVVLEQLLRVQVLFFGEQPIWEKQVHARGVASNFCGRILTQEIGFCNTVHVKTSNLHVVQVKVGATELAKMMADEDGVKGAVEAFHKHFGRRKAANNPEPPSAASNTHPLFSPTLPLPGL